MISYNDLVFKQITPNILIPAMLPNITYKYDLMVQNISMNGSGGVIKALVSNKESTVPMITANLNMPISEVEVED